MKGFITAVAALALSSALSAAQASEVDELGSHNQWQNWPTVGSADLNFLFFDIYTSELKAPHGHYQLSEDVTPHPVALSIVYERDISKKHLLKETKKQWAHLGYDEALFSDWERKLANIYPEIKKGDRLVYVTSGDTGVFYYFEKNQAAKVVGEIVDEALNDAFLAIWLSPNTEYPDHRASLIGMNQ